MPQPPRRGPRPQGPISDIERFLMEVERLRRKTAEEKQRADDDVDEVEMVGPAPPPVQRPRPRRVEPEVLEVIPAAPRPTPSAYDQAPPPPGPALSAYDQRPSPGLTTATVARPAEIERPQEIATVRTAGQGGKAVTQVSRDVVALLRSKQVQTAIILSEILGPPKCKRRRR